MDKEFDLKEDGACYFMNRIGTPKVSVVRGLVLDETHKIEIVGSLLDSGDRCNRL